ncbi:hypothetical protein ACJJTC_008444 [Scirpophaga incertulas]
MYEVKDKVFFITGGSAGIGAGIVEAFLNEGAKHIAYGDVDVKTGLKFEEELISKYGAKRVKFHKCDVTTDDLTNVMDKVHQQQGYIDVVVNCAGVMNDSIYAKMIALNVTAVVTGSFHAYEKMRKDRGGKGGTIINIASIVALYQPHQLPVYAATKAAVLQFSNCLGMEPTYSRTGVRVVTLCFGCTDTELLSTKAGVFDKEHEASLFDAISVAPMQKPQSAVDGLVDAYKKGKSGSTWLVIADQPAEDITDNVLKAYKILSKGVLE